MEEGLLPAQMFDELQGLIDAAKITDNARVEFGGESEDIAETQTFWGNHLRFLCV